MPGLFNVCMPGSFEGVETDTLKQRDTNKNALNIQGVSKVTPDF